MRFRRPIRLAWLLGCALLAASGVHAQQRAADELLTRLAGPQAKALLLFFVASDCPVSNRYFPEMERLRREFAPQAVSTRYVYPNPEENAGNVTRHQEAFHAPAPLAYLDPKGVLVDTAGVGTTPESALFVRDGAGWKELYHGRIDDRYVRFGVERQQADHHDTEDATRAMLAHHPVPPPGGPPVGCAIVKASVLHGAHGA